MTAIWSESDDCWELLAPTGFPDEKTLQDLVIRAPGMLPIGGTRTVVVLGREVRLGTGYVDVRPIEPGGCPVVIEVKLRNNAESRRAVVAQVLTYAAGCPRAGRAPQERVRLVGYLEAACPTAC